MTSDRPEEEVILPLHLTARQQLLEVLRYQCRTSVTRKTLKDASSSTKRKSMHNADWPITEYAL